MSNAGQVAELQDRVYEQETNLRVRERPVDHGVSKYFMSSSAVGLFVFFFTPICCLCLFQNVHPPKYCVSLREVNLIFCWDIYPLQFCSEGEV